MGICVELKNLKHLGGGKYEFRKPYPPSLRADLGQQLRERATIQNERDLLRWHGGLMDRWQKTVAAQRALKSLPTGTARQQWAAALVKAESMVAGAVGVDDEEAREIVADTILARYACDPEDGEALGVSVEDAVTIKALRNPEATAPEPTLRDAMAEYLKERVGDMTGRRGRNSAGGIERVFGYAFEALGQRADAPLSKLGNADGLRVRDHMLARPRQGGGTVKASSVRRELNTLSAAVELAIKNFDLELRAKNIFKRIGSADWPTRTRQLSETRCLSPSSLEFPSALQHRRSAKTARCQP